jgi:hypothetical protein
VGALVWIGAVMAAAGVGLLALVVQRARRLRGAETDAETTRLALSGLVALNFAAVALAFLGLGVLLVGLLAR